MSNPTLVQIEDLSRRDMLRNIALAFTAVAGGQLKLEAAQHVHQQVKETERLAELPDLLRRALVDKAMDARGLRRQGTSGEGA